MLSPQELHIRAAFFSAVRKFFTSHGFLEVDTPIRQPVIIPERHIEPIGAEGSYLQTSPELFMKRLLAAGCDRIFQICPCFRKEEFGKYHLEEFIMLEWYRKDVDYNYLMEDCEELLIYILSQLSQSINSSDILLESELLKKMDIFVSNRPWPRLSVQEAFAQYSPKPLEEALLDKSFDEILVEYIEPHLGQETPLFLYDYPIELASLARKKEGGDNLAERFELYYRGIELANGFSELTDANEQRDRFAEEIQYIEGSGGKSGGMPGRLLEALKNLNEAAGIALGLDRLFMLLLGKDSLAESVTFSTKDF